MTLSIIYLLSLVALAVSILVWQVLLEPRLHKKTPPRFLVSFSIVFFTFIFIDAFLLLLTKRPIFSMGLSLILLTAIMVVNNAKYAALREPLVFTDFYLYLQAFKYPRLYLPFLGVWSVVIVIFVILTFFVGLVLEAVRFSWFSEQFNALIAVAIFSLLILYWLSGTQEVSGDIAEDSKEFGVLASLILYFRHAPTSCNQLQVRMLEASPFAIQIKNNAEPADIVVIQSESFFDARPIQSQIKNELLNGYDQLLFNAEIHGKLQVPAWGANTMRTEFAFLTGLCPSILGFAQYYPYQQLLGYEVPSLLGQLKSMGYHCVCIHPHAADFFMRDKFFEQLGFDELIDIKGFKGAECSGPYISDSAVTKKIKKIIENASNPTFVFAITMENHGPLSLESVSANEWRGYFSEDPGSDLDDLTVYLRHLVNADKMVSELKAYFLSRSKSTLFGFYGDHVPAMSKVFEKLGYHDSCSNFFIWSSWLQESRGSKAYQQSRMAVEDLAVELVKTLNR